VGLRALPQVVLPDMYGTDRAGSHRLTKENQIESSAAGYAGVCATLLLAPLVWSNRKNRGSGIFWSLMVVFSLSWCLNVPGLVKLLRLPGLNLMSHNRLVFLTSFAILVMAAAGLESLRAEPVRWRRWFWIPILLLAGLCLWSLISLWSPPEPLATQFEKAIQKGERVGWARDLLGVKRIQSNFAGHYASGAAWCAMAGAGWGLVWLRRKAPGRVLPIIGLLMILDMLWFAHGRYVQCDPKLYFPKVEPLDQIAQSVPGRVLGSFCLPPTVGSMAGLRDIRGYDAVDPVRMVELLLLAAEPNSYLSPYALTQWLRPKTQFSSDGQMRLPPVLDLLNVRYVVFRGKPPRDIQPAFQGQDYWVAVNPSVMPRAFVPSHVEEQQNKTARLRALASPEFNPGNLALVEEPVNLPAECRGTAEMVLDMPTHITVSVRMDTPGLVVLADRWDRGWHATYAGKPVPILVVDHAVRGVVLPAGTGTLEFFYQPASFRLGLMLFAFAGLLLTGWAAWIYLRVRPAHSAA
jgi:hypothetical protein